MTTEGDRLPKYLRVAEAVRRQIADGTLRPGQPAPSGAALGRITGYSTLTCRKALHALVAEGVLIPGPSRNARPRVAGPAPHPAERDLAAAARRLSGGLAARRRANGLTQPQLAGRIGISVTTIGHAETGRLWQSRDFWERADAVLGARGDLLALHDAYREADASTGAETTETGFDDHDGPEPDDPPGAAPGNVGAAVPCARLAAEAAAAVAPGPACVMILWGNGAVTTVHPPGTTQDQVTSSGGKGP